MKNYHRQQKEVEILGPPLIEIKGAVYKSPVEQGWSRSIWEIPDGASHGMMFVLWLVLAREILVLMPKDALARVIVEETLSKYEKLSASYMPS